MRVSQARAGHRTGRRRVLFAIMVIVVIVGTALDMTPTILAQLIVLLLLVAFPALVIVPAK